MVSDGCNASIRVETAYYPLTANLEGVPTILELTVQISGLSTPLALPTQQYHAKGLQAKCPLLRFDNRKAHLAFDEALIADLTSGLASGRIQRGYYFDRAGAHTLPDGSTCFVRGSELLGPCGRPYFIAPEISSMRLRGNREPIPQLLPLLGCSPLQVLLVFAYVLLASIRSLLTGSGIDLQAVLYIVGGQGLGKTTLATRLAGIYEKDGVPVGIVQAGSTQAAVNTLMTGLRDQPLIVDDLCLSASKDTARKRVDLASKLIRQGTGSIPIIKKAGSTTVELPCEASLILTAEFHLENLSDLTRCIIVPVNKPLDIPAELTSEMIGDAIYSYSLWFCEHTHEEILQFRTAVDNAIANRTTDARIATNYACLAAAFCSFLRFAGTMDGRMVKRLQQPMDKALRHALREHKAMIDRLKDSIPVGNLSFCILDGYEDGAFHLTKKIEKLVKHDGIMWKGDLCLRREPLIRFIRQQSGYQDWTSNRIIRSLKDIGALVLQEENAATVRLSKEPEIPRVYRIRIQVLQETAEGY